MSSNMLSDVVQVLARAELESAVDPGAGGVQTQNQFPGGYTVSVWIATFTMFILWLLALVLCPLAATTGSRDKFAVPKALRNFARSARDGFLILIGIVTINQAGYGVSNSVMIMTWIVFALLCVWIVLQIVGVYVPWSWWINSLVFLPIMVLSIICFALAYRAAPSTR